ncbi:GNAT family N-acetyltransferase [Rhodovastum atsumiense]|uniref:GNAT family N-acetyltransferase n=1 Tax=Rhodovastum atsumiense TaxID=504468 RepID=A0A5M6ITE2_9PROT|nr:GNAT family N-acetyltransferase [Rhodovastum atsumiense]KAA5611097.1 GNAT family N-acetyltransferase [Rhodovastum atsumiense]CAH2599160.1 GNAT family N-acetyltransferase [Rhodovastum atsumiense]
MDIRDYTPADFAAATALWTLCGLHPSASDTPERLAVVARHNPGLFLVAEAEGMLIATVMGCWDGRRGWINRLAVHPDRRGEALGRRMVALVEDRLRARGCDKVNLLVEPDNAAVGAYYAAAGYTCDPLIFMEKWL